MDDEVLSGLCSALEDLINRINQQFFEDEDGRDYLCLNIHRVLSLVANASTLFEIPPEVEILLHEARSKLTVVSTQVCQFFYPRDIIINI